MVLDIRLPDEPGPALALRIHQLHPQVPGLFVSGWVDGLADPHTLGDMRWEFLQKALRQADLVAAVRRLLPAQAATG